MHLTLVRDPGYGPNRSREPEVAVRRPGPTDILATASLLRNDVGNHGDEDPCGPLALSGRSAGKASRKPHGHIGSAVGLRAPRQRSTRQPAWQNLRRAAPRS